MSSTIIGGQSYSISRDGLDLLKQGKISTAVGGISIDLASAPIPPGSYTIEISAGVGGVEIYLPRYVEFSVDSASILGSKTVHLGLDWWQAMTRKFQDLLHLSSEIPDHAVAPADSEKPVTIHFLIHTGVGGVDIYRL